jgi:hypothetical protein
VVVKDPPRPDERKRHATLLVSLHSLLIAILRRDPQTHGDHRRIGEAMFPEKCLRHIFGAIG